MTARREISGKWLAHKLKALSPTERAILALDAERGEVFLHSFGRRLAARLFLANRAYVDALAKLSAAELEAVRSGKVKLSKIANRRRDTASNRQIGRTLGVDEKTIRNDRAENSALAPKKSSENKGRDQASAENSAFKEFSGERAAKLVERRETAGDVRQPDLFATAESDPWPDLPACLRRSS